jgi:hypothetical protein
MHGTHSALELPLAPRQIGSGDEHVAPVPQRHVWVVGSQALLLPVHWLSSRHAGV